jgi:hypothetical protein
LYSSSATLRAIEEIEGGCVYHFASPVPCELVFENFERAKSVAVETNAGELEVVVQFLPDTRLSEVSVQANGEFRVKAMF